MRHDMRPPVAMHDDKRQHRSSPMPSTPPAPPDHTRDVVSLAVFSSLIRLCGGGVPGRTGTTPPAPTITATSSTDDDKVVSHDRSEAGEWHQALYDLAAKSISFTNGGATYVEDGAGGKPHDIECRAALSLFHRYKRREEGKKQQKQKHKGRKRTRDNNGEDGNMKNNVSDGENKHEDDEKTEKEAVPPLQIVSDLGLCRPIHSADQLAQLIALDMERNLSVVGVGVAPSFSTCDDISNLGTICDDIRPAGSSGILCLTTKHRIRQLRRSGKLPCPLCIKWCNGEKGLWWHRQVEHGADHGNAMEDAANATDTLAMVLYDPRTADNNVIHHEQEESNTSSPSLSTNTCSSNGEEDSINPFEYAKNGDLANFIRSVQRTRLDPATATDANGSTCLHWAAGAGHLHIVKHLIESCGCCPNVGQEGKRSFRDRTALHWASRNGHLNVVRYLLEECHEAAADMEATTVDGTTAFCWASWQGHLDVMKYLHSQGCTVHSVNSFGCNSVLWAAQGEGGLDIMKWLIHDVECDFMRINSNRHSILHKSAQRGKRQVIEWVLGYSKGGEQFETIDLIGPDLEQHCPSDLAGMEGHTELAEWLAEEEKRVAIQFYQKVVTSQYIGNIDMPDIKLPEWLVKGLKEVEGMSMLILGSKTQMNAWESGGGIRRMCRHVLPIGK